MRQLEKTEEDLFSDVLQDFHTPLSAILVQSEQLLTLLGEGAQQPEAANMESILERAMVLASLVQDLSETIDPCPEWGSSDDDWKSAIIPPSHEATLATVN